MKLRSLALHDFALAALVLVVLGALGHGMRVKAPPPTLTTSSEGAKSRFEATPILESVDQLVEEQRRAISAGDLARMVATLSDQIVGFGVDADEIGEGKRAIEAHLRRDLAWTASEITFTSLNIGWQYDHAWVAFELERDARRYVVTELAARTEHGWRVMAWHWAVVVSDAVAVAALRSRTKPANREIADRFEGTPKLVEAAKTALGSPSWYASSMSTGKETIYYGSAGERLLGGAVKGWWGRVGARLTRRGIQVFGGGRWDASQQSDAWIGVELANVRLAIGGDLEYRVMNVFVRESDGRWRIVAAQWSHGGPVDATATVARPPVRTNAPVPSTPNAAGGSNATPTSAPPDLLAEAEDKYVLGDYVAAERVARQAWARRVPGAALVVAMAACKQGRSEVAAKLTGQLSGPERTRLAAACPTSPSPTPTAGSNKDPVPAAPTPLGPQPPDAGEESP